MNHKIALFYHLNLSHYSLTPTLRRMYINEGIEHLSRLIQVPTNLSLSAQDLECIYKENRSAYDALLKNRNIKFHISSYSHFLPSDFPRDLEVQLSLGHNLFNRLIPLSRIVNTGFFAEFDIPKDLTGLELVSHYFDTLLVNYTLINHEGIDKCPGIFTFKLPNNMVLRMVCVHKNTRYRSIYHKYLREFASIDDVITALHEDSNLDIPTICHVDFEAPIINIIETSVNNKNHKYPPRYDLFKALHNEFSKTNLNFVYLDPDLYQGITGSPINNLSNDLSLEVTRNEYYYNLVTKLNKNRDEYIACNEVAYMNAINSDNFVIDQKDIKLDGFYNGELGTITINKSGNRKHIMDSLIKELDASTDKLDV